MNKKKFLFHPLFFKSSGGGMIMMKSRLSKTLLGLFMVMVFVCAPSLGPVGATEYNTHIDLDNFCCHKDENISISAQLWQEGMVFNSRLSNEIINFYIYDTKQKSVIVQKTSHSNWNGWAACSIDTHSLNPGNYSIIVDYNGKGQDYLGYFIYYAPSTKTSKLTILP